MRMGTNFYLRKKQPTIRKTIHIGKRSFGWLMHWDSCDENNYPRWCDLDPNFEERNRIPHGIHSVEDIRAYLRTGEWELVDEDNEVYEDWEEMIDELCSWDGGKRAFNESNPDKPVAWDVQTPSGSRDHEGQIFDRGEGFC